MTSMEPDGLFFNMLQVKAGLEIQAKTGLRHSRGSVLKYAKQTFGIKGVRIKSAAEQMEALVAGAKAARLVLDGATHVDCPYHTRELRETFIRGAEMIGVKLNPDGSL